MTSIAILWAQYGPYHFARARALQELAKPVQIHALELANHSSDYAWTRSADSVGLTTVCPGMVTEQLSFQTVFQNTRRTFKKLEVEVCLLPGYSPRQPLAALLAAKSLGIKTVLMNESHAGTARSGLVGTMIKRRLVKMFDAGLVGGAPQKKYFTSLGMAEHKIFTGYNAVDNDYFSQGVKEIKNRPDETRQRHGLPEHYFLSLGRFVAKKNLETLLRAYRKFLDLTPDPKTHLVLVGSGEEEPKLKTLCEELKLATYHPAKTNGTNESRTPTKTTVGVHFLGFRQVEENPSFYALADAFVLPSLYEEWGLVVNEAMASGLPVAVSETAGCAEDLLEQGRPHGPGLNGTLDASLKNGLSKCIRRNGFVFNPTSIEEVAAIFKILESQKELRETMGTASQEIVEKFTCQRFAENALRAARAALGQSE